jgi:hypothetical protein
VPPRQYFRVVGLEKRQHYRDRNPPWIKSHTERLEDVDFAALPDNAKAHVLLIELLAARMGNRVPLDERFVRARINARSRVNLPLLLDQGLIEIVASEPLADCSQPARPEREQRREETEERQIPPPSAPAEVAEFNVPKNNIEHIPPPPKNGTTTAPRETWLTKYGDAWRERWGPESEPPYGQMAQYIAPAIAGLDGDDTECLRRWVCYLATCNGVQYCSPATFRKGLGTWGTSTAKVNPNIKAVRDL